MRIDKFLKVARIIKRRTIANEACDNGRVSVNGRQVRASYEIKENDLVEIVFGSRTVRLRVRSVREFSGKDDAALMYEVLE